MRRAVRPLKRIYSSHNLAAVHHARNLLETEGIRAVVKNEFLSSAMGDLPPAECQAEVWVLFEQDFGARRGDPAALAPATAARLDLRGCGEACEAAVHPVLALRGRAVSAD